SDRPFGHVAAVGPATDGEAVGIGDAAVDEVLHAGHDVLEVAATPVGTVGFDESFAVADGAPDGGIENGVAARGEKLAPNVDRVRPAAGGAAVNEDDGGELVFDVADEWFQ